MSQVLRSLSGRRLLVFCILEALPRLLPAQSAVLQLESAVVVPGSEFELALTARLDRPIRGYQIGVEFPQNALSLTGVSLEETDLPAQRPDVFLVSIAQGYGTVRLVLDDRPPLENGIPAGNSVRLGRFRFRMAQGLHPGAEYAVKLKGDLGFPPLPALIYTEAGAVPPVAMVEGQVQVIDRNVLRIKDLVSVGPNAIETLEISAFNISPLQGFSIGVRFDPALVKFLEADFTDTITEAVGAEYVASIIDNNRGHFLLGVLLDSLPPFLSQVIPAAGLDLTIAKAKIQVVAAPGTTRNVELELADGLGAPPIRNLFVIENQSVQPVKQNGRLQIVADRPFLRGDVNEDGRLDISDPIAQGEWLFLDSREVECQKAGDADDDGDTDLADMVYVLRYLFNRGPILPAPFPVVGFDPTPDALRCPP